MIQPVIQVTVGMPVTRHPPYRSVREELPHTAPTSGDNAEISFAYTIKTDRRSNPPLCADRGGVHGVPLGQRPSLHLLRKGFHLIVRRFLRYYVVVRLP